MGTRPTTQRVAANVRAELAVRRISGTALAGALGITRSTMARRLRGDTPWPVDDLERIAEFLNVTVDSLLSERAAA
jgi:transcriptional regulator with XRE-family HTH domain